MPWPRPRRFKTDVVAIGVLVVSGLLFRVALPRKDGKKRWFIGTVWEAYIAVILGASIVLSLGFVAWSIVAQTMS